MTLFLPPLARRALALLILLTAIAGIYVLIVGPLISEYAVTRDSVGELKNTLGRYRAAGSQFSAREALLKALQGSDPGREGFLPGGNDNLIAGSIQTRIKAVAEAARGELKSTQILPPSDEGKLRRIAIRAQMTVTLEAAQKVFYGIEAGTPYLFVDNLSMNARTGLRARSEANESPLIDMQFDVSGYTGAEASK